MAGSQYRMVIDDPDKIDLLTDDMKRLMLQGAVATVNVMAALTRKNAIKNLNDDFTLRNKFTTGGINLHFDKSDDTVTDLKEVQAVFGAKRMYMERQEEGGIHDDPGGGRLAIPTDAARGGSNKNAVPRENYIKNVRKKMYRYDPRHVVNSKIENANNLVSAAASAYEDGAFLEYNKNIYRVTDFKKFGDDVQFELEMIYFRGLEKTTTPAKPWLEPAAEKPVADRQKIFNSQMNKLDK
ncbi:MAG: hypothetical protein IJ191_09185 [Treponema sp.]|nr:hypothetical protein [Treponema sp.]